MRRLVAALGMTLTLALSWPAAARTPGPVCRRECGSRVAEQCDGLGARAFRTCRKSVVRACKRTDPAVACSTTIELTRALAGRVVRAGAPAALEVALCESGRFASLENDPASGTWNVRLVGGSLALELEGGGAPSRQLRLERDASDAVLIDGASAELADGTVACTPAAPAPPAPPAPPAQEPRLDATLVALARALADRIFTRVIDGGSTVDTQTIALCASGRAKLVSVVTAAGSESVETLFPTWTIRVSGGATLLGLDITDGESRVIPVAIGDDGQPLVDGTPVELRDARATCADLDLQDRLTQAVNDTAFSFSETVVGIPVRIKIGLCASGRHVTLTTTSPVHGPWRVDVVGGTAELQLLADTGAVFRHFPVAFDAGGVVRVNGQAGPVDDEALVALACEG
jgi:hypothetical protein